MQWSSLFLYSAVSVLQPTGGERDNILPSWSSTNVRHGLVESIERMANAGSPEFVKVDERVAVVVGDGALWSEALSGADDKVLSPDTDGSLRSFADYSEQVRALLSSSGPTASSAKYREFAYQPLKELVGFLKAHQFQIWVLSFGDHEVDRTMVELNYGLERFRVIEVIHRDDAMPSTDLARSIWERIGTTPKVFLGHTQDDLGLLELAGKADGVLKIQIAAGHHASARASDPSSYEGAAPGSSWNFVISPEEHWLRRFSWQAPVVSGFRNNQ